MKKPVPFGKYYLLERINVGGMAEVFRAKAYGVEGFERLVAVKRILPNIAEDKDFITMFIDEAKIAVQLTHANIAQIFDLGVVDGAYYIALEHIFGRDLRAIYDRCRHMGEPMPIAQACFVLMKVCEGLDYAHNKRDQAGRELHLVHRDVSPQNIIVSFEGEVKVIDFGIAKAAGKGSKTQAGILKGKFGYMSPEQVRGLPIDRRSDIFSCGIVLYELLTGERLFVGESDFSTLEKVRNVEILPPSTYNRKIPDELERIVLKALSKDVEDRYQNAIDLHDELQAFVYTAGEFYSRKDLAAWMKPTFRKEIDAESARLEEYRQLPPPQGLVADGGRPAPIDARAHRRSSAPGMEPGRLPPPEQLYAGGAAQSGDLEWDDDELETQIYDDEPPPPGMPAVIVAAGAAGAGMDSYEGDEPDLSGLVPSSAAWPSSRGGPSSSQSPPMGASPPPLASGSNNTPTPFDTRADTTKPTEEPSAVVRLIGKAQSEYADGQRRDRLPAPAFAAGGADAYSFGATLESREPASKSGRAGWLLAGLVVVVGFGAAAAVFVNQGPDGPERDALAAAGSSPQPGDPASGIEPADPAPAPSPSDLDTGFDVIVSPAGARIELDGEDVGPAPRRIRNIAAGGHVLDISAPGFFAKREEVSVEQGQAETIRITLDAIDVIGHFTSEPPGASVTLVADGSGTNLGAAPAEAKLDPRMRYEVMFQKPGYVTVTRPIDFTGAPELNVAVVLERASVGSPSASRDRPRDTGTPRGGGADPTTLPPSPSLDDGAPAVPGPSETRAPRDEPLAAPAVLLIGAKPPCRIFIDGKDTGLMTPQRDLEVSEGIHKVTLVNNEFEIKKTIVVKVKAGEEMRIIEDFTDQL